MSLTPALLAMEDGTVFRGRSMGAEGVAVGEVVFNTAMTGYQEILTDPSYARQIVTLTYPQIGNTGTNAEDVESSAPAVAGLVIRQLPRLASSWRQAASLQEYLAAAGIAGITEVDTRRLTRLIRDKGAMAGCLAAADISEAEAVRRAREFPGLEGMDLARAVTCAAPYEWSETTWRLGEGYAAASAPGQVAVASEDAERPHVLAYDFGVKRNILRILTSHGCRVTVVPATTPADEALALRPDGVFLSNGPGDPAPCDYAIAAIRQFLEAETPLFGICLGHQLLALASGARTVKMPHGHHGANHPVQDLETGEVFITSQNHGFAVDAGSLPDCLRATHVSLFDGSLQGIARQDRPAFGFQGHPEASPGPQEAGGQFDRFVASMRRQG